jgi:hypothetical protein
MARTATGISKKANRENAKALALALAWKYQFGIGVKMDSAFAWVMSDGKFGTKPDNYGAAMSTPSLTEIEEPTIDTFMVALYCSRKGMTA